MKIVKKFFDVTPDMRDGFGCRREFDSQEEYKSVEEYTVERMQDVSSQGTFEQSQEEITKLQRTVARIVDKMAEVLRLSAEDIAEIVGDYIDNEEIEIRLEE